MEEEINREGLHQANSRKGSTKNEKRVIRRKAATGFCWNHYRAVSHWHWVQGIICSRFAWSYTVPKMLLSNRWLLFDTSEYTCNYTQGFLACKGCWNLGGLIQSSPSKLGLFIFKINVHVSRSKYNCTQCAHIHQ